MAMFLSEQLETQTNYNGNGISSSCPSGSSGSSGSSVSSGSSAQYGFIILFNWDEEIEKPFALFSRNAFSKHEITDRCYSSKLSDEYRIKRLKSLKEFPGNNMSLFSKVEGCKCRVRILYL